MKWLSDILCTFSTDKVWHYFVGYVIMDIIFKFVILNVYVVIIIGILASAAIAYLKEQFDKYIKKTKADIKDIIATITGSILKGIIILI